MTTPQGPAAAGYRERLSGVETLPLSGYLGGMADIFAPEVRSRIMSRIRGKDTKPERLVRKILRDHGIRYRMNDRTLPGSPDLVLKDAKVAVLVHGCFWHGHRRCRRFRMPKSRVAFWRRKIETNRARDARVRRRLRRLGWKVVTVWECQLERNPLAVAERIFRTAYGSTAASSPTTRQP